MCDTTLHQPAQWAQLEFSNTQLGDPRRSRRLVQVASALAQCPSGTLPQALPTWKELKAAYRLFSNDDVTYQRILAPHCERTRQRCMEPGEYLWIEDTSELDYTFHFKAKGLGRIGNDKGRGLLLHKPDGTSYAVGLSGTDSTCDCQGFERHGWHAGPDGEPVACKHVMALLAQQQRGKL